MTYHGTTHDSRARSSWTRTQMEGLQPRPAAVSIGSTFPPPVGVALTELFQGSSGRAQSW
jgi:hypothetical protein